MFYTMIRSLWPWVLILLVSTCKNSTQTNPRLSQTINANWTFNYFPDQNLDSGLVQQVVNDSQWPAIAIPHTWQTYETTGEKHPFIRNASERDDPYWWYGWGIYRKKISLASDLMEKKVFIEFDGVQKYSRLYLNGHYIGDHKGGFTSFYFDLTPYVNWQEENVLTVAVNNRRNDQYRIPPMTAGNWNVYGGIYRDVRLVIKDKLYIPFQGSYRHEGGTFVTTPLVNQDQAVVNIKTFVKNEYEQIKNIRLTSIIYDASGSEISKVASEHQIQAGELKALIHQTDTLSRPRLWSPANPELYKVVSVVESEGGVTDQMESPLGFRWFHWDYENDNLYINGERMNILGTNRHQEYPWLGDAHPKWIARMDMYDIKYNLGHNFMRLTHYPNDKYLYQLADSFGIAMVEEVPNIKDIDFSEEVQEQHVREMIRRDRNHPSILFWSMGNETSDAADSRWAIEEDTTRIIHLRKGEYGGDFVDHTHENLDMEQLLRVTVRGWFTNEDAPEGFTSQPENGQHSSNETWQHQMARLRGGSTRGVLGDNCNAWLYEDHGADREYLNCILKHINPKGWVDMYRQPKYLYHLTKAYYTDQPTVFIHPHYWRRKYLGTKQDIVIDANLEEVELWVNGSSYGSQKTDSMQFNSLTFEDIPVSEGILKAAGSKNGQTFEHVVQMPDKPAQISLTTNQPKILADRSGIAIVTANILDQNGNPVFDANNTLQWQVEGPGKLVGPNTYESDINKFEAWEGTGYTVVPVSNIVRSTNQPGNILVTVSAEGLEPASLTINTYKPDSQEKWFSAPDLTEGGRKQVIRDPSYSYESFIPEEMFALRGNRQIEGHNYETYRENLDQFIDDTNHGMNSDSYGYDILLDVMAKKLVNLAGELIADDYNFMRDQFNQFRVLERAIDASELSQPEQQALKEKYAREIILQGLSLEVNRIAREF